MPSGLLTPFTRRHQLTCENLRVGLRSTARRPWSQFTQSCANAIRRFIKDRSERRDIPLRPSTAHAACEGVVEQGGPLKGAGPIGGQRTTARAPPADVEIPPRR